MRLPRSLRQLAVGMALILAIGTVGSAAPPPYDFPALNLYNHFKTNDTSCSDFLATMDSAIAQLSQLGFLVTRLVCAPSGATLMQDRLIFLRFAETHPEFLHRNAVEVYLAAEMNAFPCRNQLRGTGE